MSSAKNPHKQPKRKNTQPLAPSQVPDVPHDSDQTVLHEPIMVAEIVLHLKLKPTSTVIDGTLGLGGHAAAILPKLSKGKLLGVDRDIASLALARDHLTEFGSRLSLVHGNFANLELVAPPQFRSADAILLDLGISSWQLATRGFSFATDAPLDFRMDRRDQETAADLVNGLPEGELADLLYQNAEEYRSRRVAAAIVAARSTEPITTTVQLAEVVEKALGRRRRTHPATKTFQALRMAVNDELGSLTRGLGAAENLLKPGGRLAVISFHSGEDRLIKRFNNDSQHLTKVNKKVIQPTRAEQLINPRSRSAKLRVAEKVQAVVDS